MLPSQRGASCSSRSRSRVAHRRAGVKCVVWDLDGTVWDGILLEDRNVRLNPHVVETLRRLDARGILHSIASRNDEHDALAELDKQGIRDFFLYPQINWNAKAVSVARIAELLRIGLDTIAFVDDEQFDREEVQFSHPSVRCYPATDVAMLPELHELTPATITVEARNRRQLYAAQAVRDEKEREFVGPQDAFLASLGMSLTISRAGESDLTRSEELTVRTHQLNTTGRTFSKTELVEFVRSPTHEVFVARLIDKYGPYGQIGLGVVERRPQVWRLRLFLLSCRVLSRGIGAPFLRALADAAAEEGASLEAEVIPNERNRMMLVTLRFLGFREATREGPVTVLRAPAELPPFPSHLSVRWSERDPVPTTVHAE
jgi:FkbH-like protein